MASSLPLSPGLLTLSVITISLGHLNEDNSSDTSLSHCESLLWGMQSLTPIAPHCISWAWRPPIFPDWTCEGLGCSKNLFPEDPWFPKRRHAETYPQRALGWPSKDRRHRSMLTKPKYTYELSLTLQPPDTTHFGNKGFYVPALYTFFLSLTLQN